MNGTVHITHADLDALQHALKAWQTSMQAFSDHALSTATGRSSKDPEINGLFDKLENNRLLFMRIARTVIGSR